MKLPYIAPLAYWNGEHVVVECFLFIFGRAFKIGGHKGLIPPVRIGDETPRELRWKRAGA